MKPWTAYGRGRQAFEEGAPIAMNPYSIWCARGNRRHLRWRLGWLNAKEKAAFPSWKKRHDDFVASLDEAHDEHVRIKGLPGLSLRQERMLRP